MPSALIPETVAVIPAPDRTTAFSRRVSSTGTDTPSTVAALSPAETVGASGAIATVVVVGGTVVADAGAVVFTRALSVPAVGWSESVVVARVVVVPIGVADATIEVAGPDWRPTDSAAVVVVAATTVVVVGGAVLVVVVVVGGWLTTVNENVAVEVPPEFTAVMVCEVADWVAVGVPLTSPVEELNDSPAGSAGEMEYDAVGPPELEIV